MVRSSTIVLIALLLIASTVQCAAACVPVMSGCHHHKQKAPACTNELVPAVTAPHYDLTISFASEPVEIFFAPTPRITFDKPLLQDQSPPTITPTLRI